MQVPHSPRIGTEVREVVATRSYVVNASPADRCGTTGHQLTDQPLAQRKRSPKLAARHHPVGVPSCSIAAPTLPRASAAR